MWIKSFLFVQGEYLLLFGLLKGSSCGYLQNSENSFLPIIFSSWANSSAWVSDANNITLCYSVLFKQSRQRKSFQSLVTLAKKCQTLAMTVILPNKQYQKMSTVLNQIFIFSLTGLWIILWNANCMLIRPWGSEFCFSYVIFSRKIIQRAVLFLIFNFQKWD